MIDLTNALGFVAAVCTTSAYVPQVLKTWRTRSTQDLSLPMYAVILTGTLFWLSYGIANHQIPLIAANTATACMQAFILSLKIRHG